MLYETDPDNGPQLLMSLVGFKACNSRCYLTWWFNVYMKLPQYLNSQDVRLLWGCQIPLAQLKHFFMPSFVQVFKVFGASQVHLSGEKSSCEIEICISNFPLRITKRWHWRLQRFQKATSQHAAAKPHQRFFFFFFKQHIHHVHPPCMSLLLYKQ